MAGMLVADGGFGLTTGVAEKHKCNTNMFLLVNR
jgi:hypothetical protein